MTSLDQIRPIKERVEADFLSRPGVSGVDIGNKYVGGVRTPELAIRVFVKKSSLYQPTKLSHR